MPSEVAKFLELHTTVETVKSLLKATIFLIGLWLGSFSTAGQYVNEKTIEAEKARIEFEVAAQRKLSSIGSSDQCSGSKEMQQKCMTAKMLQEASGTITDLFFVVQDSLRMAFITTTFLALIALALVYSAYRKRRATPMGFF